MTKRVLLTLIDQECLANFTWTGKTKIKGERKESFKKLTNIHKVIITVLSKLDASFNSTVFNDDIVNHVMKYAYSKEVKGPVESAERVQTENI